MLRRLLRFVLYCPPTLPAQRFILALTFQLHRSCFFSSLQHEGMLWVFFRYSWLIQPQSDRSISKHSSSEVGNGWHKMFIDKQVQVSWVRFTKPSGTQQNNHTQLLVSVESLLPAWSLLCAHPYSCSSESRSQFLTHIHTQLSYRYNLSQTLITSNFDTSQYTLQVLIVTQQHPFLAQPMFLPL